MSARGPRSLTAALPGEFALIERLKRLAGRPLATSPVRVGIGDDCAVLSTPGLDTLVTTDMLVEGIHFRFDWMDDRSVGVRAIVSNLSDIAAMGGTPAAWLLGLGVPAGFSGERVAALVRSMCTPARRAGALLVGGDLSRSPGPLVIAITMLGLAPPGMGLQRSTAAPGDAVFVAGTLGDVAVALARLERGERPSPPTVSPWRALCRPRARVALGQRLRQSGLVSACLDVSDGLAQDLGHIARASRVAIEFDLASLPLTRATRAWAAALGLPWNGAALAAASGEEFALAFTARPDSDEALRALAAATPEARPLRRIGRVVAGPPEVRPLWRGRPIVLAERGFAHF